MNEYGEILIRLGRIEGELIAIRKLSERVSKLERWQYWMKGTWGGLVGTWLYLCRHAFGK